MPELFEDTASRLWWGVRRYLWVFFVTVPIAVVALVAASPGNITREYQTSSLVVAKDRGEIATDSLARLYESVFAAGTVAQRAVTLGDLPINPRDLIPDHATLEPVEANIVAHVVGAHPEAALAQRIADSTATALVEELNRVFEGQAVFEKLGEAPVPEEAVTSVSRVVPGVLGIAVGTLAGLGLIGLLLTLRRPILSAEEAAALVSAPIVGTPTLPTRRGLPPDPSQVPGLAALVKRLFPDAAGTAVLIAHTRAEELRTILAQMIATTLGRSHPTFLVSSRDAEVRWLYDHLETGPKVVVTDSLPDPSTWTRLPIVIDGPSARGSDTPQLIPELAQIVLVVHQGVARGRILEVSSQFLPGEITGVLFARRGHSWPWHAGPRRTARPQPDAAVSTPVAQPRSGESEPRRREAPRSPEPTQRSSDDARPSAERRVADDERATASRSEPSPRPSSPQPEAESRPPTSVRESAAVYAPEQASLLGPIRKPVEITLDETGGADGAETEPAEEPAQTRQKTLTDGGSISQRDASVE